MKMNTNTATIVVQMSDRQWTMKAMHLACAMARNTQSSLVLLHLRPVKNPGLLGSGIGLEVPSVSEYQDLEDYGMIAEDYGVTLTVQPMAYESLVDALAQSAEYLNASALFAQLSESVFALWHRVQRWNLRRQLESHHCHLYTLETPVQADEWMPSISLKASK